MNEKIKIQFQNTRNYQCQSKDSVTDIETDEDMDCSCEILGDSDLSNVSDSSCSCSDCLQANLNAFNQFKHDTTRMVQNFRSSSLKRQTRDNLLKEKETSRNFIPRNKSTDILRKKTVLRPRQRNRINEQELESQKETVRNGLTWQGDYIDGEFKDFSEQNINDYILITKQRTRKFLAQRKKLERQAQKQKQDLRQKIKENLEILKHTAQILMKKDLLKKGINEPKNQKLHPFQWMHAPTADLGVIKPKKCCHKQRHIPKVNTNLQKLIPTFNQNRDSILLERRQKRLQQLKEPEGCPFDNCPNHHMRSQPQKLKKIEKFIKKQVQKYKKKMKRQKQTEDQQKKTKQAKLRAIDIKCKQMVSRCKKMDPTQSRTTFRLSIDHFSTFSQLRQCKKKMDQQKKRGKQSRTERKQGENQEDVIVEENYGQQVDMPCEPNPSLKIHSGKNSEAQKGKKSEKDKRKQKNKEEKSEVQNHKEKDKKQQKKSGGARKDYSSLLLSQEEIKKQKLKYELERKKRDLYKQMKKQQQLKNSKKQRLRMKQAKYPGESRNISGQ